MADIAELDLAELARAAKILNEAVEQRAFPGAALAVGYQNRLAIVPAGRLSYSSDAPAVRADTIYDLASLTKVLATTAAAMILADRKQLHIHQPVAACLPDFVPPYDLAEDPLWVLRQEVTIGHLLAHTSGLPAYERFFLRARDKEQVIAEALALPLEEPPGEETLYSDVGFILLGEIVEHAAGEPLDQFCAREVFQPLGMASTCFNPPPDLQPRIAPTEEDASFRKRLIRGEVQDENAWVMGGVAGHAGLFGTAQDLAAFCWMMLRGGSSGERQLIQPATVAEFTRAWPARHGVPRGLGWDKPSEPSSSGRFFSPASFGHLGYTGTSLWIDPQKQLWIALLTNRIHPTRANDAIRRVRPAVHDAVMEALR